ncbi:MAG: hypothetical protein ACI4EW_01260 [Butyrivibrio sp.]
MKKAYCKLCGNENMVESFQKDYLCSECGARNLVPAMDAGFYSYIASLNEDDRTDNSEDNTD